MIKDIVKDDFFLSQVSENATIEDKEIIQHLKDTLNANKDKCVGMAANMIGYKKRILIFYDNKTPVIMVNPTIIQHSKTQYTTEEGCLSHNGVKETKRYDKIKVQYLDESYKLKIKTYQGFTAQIIQHEMDHFEGILI